MGARIILTGVLAVAVATASCGNSDDSDGFVPPVDPGPGGILFTASGGLPAVTGYPFPPANAGDVAFVDGWQLDFSRLLVTFDNLTLSETPDLSGSDPSATGNLVAQVNGPWAIDLAYQGSGDLAGEGPPGERAVAITAITSQNRNGDKPFATDGTRYALGFDVVAATASARAVNLDAGAAADYQQMIQDGCAVLYVGTATFQGGSVPGFTGCNVGHESWPTVVPFRLCFKSPATYANCQNPENDPTLPVAGEQSARGVSFAANDSIVGQLTMRPDHPFWDSVLPDSPPHFDQLAARLVGEPDVPADDPTGAVTLEMTQGIDFAAYTDAGGHALSWRACLQAPTDAHDVFSGPMAFDPQTVPRAVAGDPSTGLRDYYDFATYDQSTQWTLNDDGRCAVTRHYPSPP